MAAENKTGFLIDGTIYDTPGVLDLTTGEARVLYEYSQYTIEDFLPLFDDTEDLEDEVKEASRKLREPAFLTAMMHIAYQRGNPQVKPAKVRALIGATNFFEALTARVDDELEDEGGDGVPPASTSEQTASSESSSLENTLSPPPSVSPPGNGSENGSDAQEDQPATTTASRSGTSSRFVHPI